MAHSPGTQGPTPPSPGSLPGTVPLHLCGVHLTLVSIAGSMSKVFFLNPFCQEDEVMGRLVHSFADEGGQGQELHRFHLPEGAEKARAWARGGRYLRGASWRQAARGTGTALLWSSRLCRPGLLGSSPHLSRFLRCGSQTEAPAAR